MIRTDSSAAIGVVKRSGLGGRTRHVQVQYLWVQGELRNGNLGIAKVDSHSNPADILTKCVGADVFNKHLATLGFTFSDTKEGHRELSRYWQ